LKRIRGSAGFKDTATQGICAGFLNCMSDFQNLFARFNGTWARNDRDFCPANVKTIQLKNGIMFMELTGSKLVWFGNALHFHDTWQRFEDFLWNVMSITNRANDGLFHTENRMGR